MATGKYTTSYNAVKSLRMLHWEITGIKGPTAVWCEMIRNCHPNHKAFFSPSQINSICRRKKIVTAFVFVCKTKMQVNLFAMRYVRENLLVDYEQEAKHTNRILNCSCWQSVNNAHSRAFLINPTDTGDTGRLLISHSVATGILWRIKIYT